MEEHLLGFDVRELWLDPATQWDDERRAVFLLATTVAKPLSLDAGVWPSVFDLLDLKRPAWIGANADLWENLEHMEQRLAEAGPAADQRHTVIAITWLSREAGQRVGGPYGPYAEPTQPPQRDPTWELLGFDIADGSTSGLTNCGYQADEVPALRAQFAPSLNEHHLFTTIEAALAFCAVSDQRAPGHAPFHVFGLYEVRVGGSALC